ncbi:hypothetical protein Y032_0034g2887 [Ancylostoma ceylanicum]|uniref:Uncharacterized protein n=1 Tax=Ancylostoma ceylanicum TaxID=53326 RepID=A0A016UP45_9BILA|nr:hypothetical protein Y032_0034g2887 [Ancylostoma ceylanicum]
MHLVIVFILDDGMKSVGMALYGLECCCINMPPILFAHAATTLSIANCPLDGDGRIASSHGLRRTKEPIVLWALTFSVSYHML